MSDQLELEEVEDNDADFLAGYNGTPTETPEPQPDAITPEVTPPEPKYVTEDQIQDLVMKAINPGLDKAYGKIGSVERALQEIQAKTPAGEAVDFDEADFAELIEEYPELGALTMTAMSRVFSKVRGTGTQFDPDKIHSSVDERLTAREAERQAEQIALVHEDHPDWHDVMYVRGQDGKLELNEDGSPKYSADFQAWYDQQPERYQRKLSRSWDADVVSDALDQFKKDREQKAAPTPKPEETPNPRQQRLKDAVTPKGAGGHAPPGNSEEDDFVAGYKSQQR